MTTVSSRAAQPIGPGGGPGSGPSLGSGPTVRTPRLPWPVKFVALSLIWGSSFLLMKLGLAALAPIQISWLRVLTGAGVLLGLLAASGQRLPGWGRIWLHVGVSGFFLAALPFTLFAASEQHIPSALAGIGNATTPLASVLFGALLLPAVQVPRRSVVAVVLGLAGVVVIMQPWELAGAPDPVGFGMALVAGSSYGLGWTYVRRTLSGAGLADRGGLALPAAQLVAAAVQLSLVALVWWVVATDLPTPFSAHPGDAAAPDGPGVPVWAAFAAVAVLGAVGTGLAQMFQFDVVRAAGPTVATTVTYLIPVVAVTLGVVFLGERLDWPQLLGAAVVLACAVVIGSGVRRER